MKCRPPATRPHDLEALREEFRFAPEVDELAPLLAVWAQRTRLRVLALLDRTGEMCVCDIAGVLELSVPAVSQHLGRMRAHRLVRTRREGQTVYYALADHPVNDAIRAVLAEMRRGLEG